MQRLWLPLALATLCSSCLVGRAHIQDDGLYALTFIDGEVIRDSCGHLALMPASGGLRTWGNARLTVLGDTVRMHADLYESLLVGGYQRALGEDGREHFILDGSTNNVTANIAGAQCLVDIVTMHIEANTEAPDRFTGVLSVRYETRQPASCSCEYLVNFRAAITTP